MDNELLNNVKEARQFVYQTMVKVRDGKLDTDKANVVNKGAKEMVNLGRLELDVKRFMGTK